MVFVHDSILPPSNALSSHPAAAASRRMRRRCCRRRSSASRAHSSSMRSVWSCRVRSTPARGRSSRGAPPGAATLAGVRRSRRRDGRGLRGSAGATTPWTSRGTTPPRARSRRPRAGPPPRRGAPPPRSRAGPRPRGRGARFGRGSSPDARRRVVHRAGRAAGASSAGSVRTTAPGGGWRGAATRNGCARKRERARKTRDDRTRAPTRGARPPTARARGGGAASTREAILKCALPAPGEVPSVVADVSVVSN